MCVWGGGGGGGGAGGVFADSVFYALSNGDSKFCDITSSTLIAPRDSFL